MIITRNKNNSSIRTKRFRFSLTKLLFISLLPFLIVQCSSKKNIPKRNTITAKATKTNILNPELIVYNTSLDSSSFYYSISSENTLYTRKDKLSAYHSSLKISYLLYPYGDSKTIIDSASFYINDKVRTKTLKKLTGSVKLSTPRNRDYLLKIVTKDLNRGAFIEKKIYINKTDLDNHQYFLLLKDSSYTPIYETYITDTNNLILSSSINKNKTLYVKYYNRDFKIAAPPFASVNTLPFNYKSNRVKEIILNDKGTSNLDAPKNGFIQIQSDTTNKKGLTLFKFSPNFPRIVNANGLIDPLRYICSTAEYNELLSSDTPKISVDEFWLSKASSKDRARELIKQYYNRVENANKYYTSHKEGWKTDRGMISIIFGSPTLIRRTPNSETWIYGEENNLISLNFIFRKRENPFSANDYKLERSSTYKSSWYRAVDTWRAGRVFYGY